jgi:hypothetical protein
VAAIGRFLEGKKANLCLRTPRKQGHRTRDRCRGTCYAPDLLHSQGGSHARTNSDRRGCRVRRWLPQLHQQWLAESGELRSFYDYLPHDWHGHGNDWYRNYHRNQYGHWNDDGHWHDWQHWHRHDNQPAAHNHSADESAAASLMRDRRTTKTREARAARVFTCMRYIVRSSSARPLGGP